MTTKEVAIKSIGDLPESADWTDMQERVRFQAGIDKGLEDIKAGRIIPHEEVKASLKKWLSE